MPLTPKLPRRTAWISKPAWRSARESGERRDLERVPLEIFLDEYVDDRPHRALTTNVSATGLYMHRVARPGRVAQFRRTTKNVQLEFKLPGTRVELVDMARGHRSLLRDYLYDYRRRRLEQILELIRANRYH
jgi:hypothetical protein